MRVRDDVLVIQTLLWPDEVRDAQFPSLDESVTIKPAELKMASMLVDSFADDFRPEDYTDEYRVELQQLIDAKLEGEEAFPTPEKDDEGEDAEVVDLLAALQRSVERHKNDAKSDDGKASGGAPKSSAKSTTKSTAKTDDAKPAAAKTTRKPRSKPQSERSTG
jgi:DNA end-binding protein Ku